MIPVHRLGQGAERIILNPDLLVSVEAHPDTVLTLTTGAKIVVAEAPEQVVRLVRAWRTRIIRDALGPAPRGRLAAVGDDVAPAL